MEAKRNKKLSFIAKLGMLTVFVIAGFFVFNASYGVAAKYDKSLNDLSGEGLAGTATGGSTGIVGSASNPQQVAKQATASCSKWRIDCWFLYALFKLGGVLLTAAGVLMDLAVKPDTFYTVITNNTAIYELWKNIRDMLNILFILVLLFSAFATIFQVSKYHIITGKILLNVVLMALLVNFSYPITRFIIDISNVMLYYFLNLMLESGSSGGTSGIIMSYSKLADNLLPTGQNMIVDLLVAVIFIFLLAFMLLGVGIIAIVRLAALSMLIVFSPIGFVGYVAAGTPLESTAGKWWGYLWKYAFCIVWIVMMLYISIKFLGAFNLDSSIQSENASMGGGTLVGNIVKAAVPIIFLWMGFFAALDFCGAAGGMAGKAVNAMANKAKGLVKSGGMKVLRGTGGAVAKIPAVNRTIGKYQGMREAIKEEGLLGGKKKQAAARDEAKEITKAKIKARMDGKSEAEINAAGEKVKQAIKEKKNREDIKKESENWEGKTIKQIVDEIEKIENGFQDGSQKPDQATMNKLAGLRRAAKGDSKAYEDEMKERVKNNNPYSVAQPDYNEANHQKAMETFKTQYIRPPAGLSPGALATWNQERANMQAELKAFEDEKRMFDKWKKDEKDYYNEEASKLIKEHSKYASKAVRGNN